MNTRKILPFTKAYEKNLGDERFTQDGNTTASSYEILNNEKLAVSVQKKPESHKKNIENSKTDRVKMTDALGTLLADNFFLYLKTQNYHWNITGKNFLSLHTLFMNQYVDLALAIDLIAERIRALGQFAPGTFVEFSEITSIKEDRGVEDAEQMLRTLHDDQQVLIQNLRSIMSTAESNRDYTTAELITQRLQVHEKNRWILNSFINGYK